MATYAIGDIHGCFKTLRALLRDIGFKPRKDRLWLVGDLVNRGPRSLQVLRWATEHDARLTAVLGNHDLHLLARADGSAESKARDTLDKVLAAPDAPELLAWLRARPFFHREGRFAVVHAGLHPSWSYDDAERWSRKVSAKLQAKNGGGLITALRRRPPPAWSEELSKSERRRAALYAFTLLRTCRADGTPCGGFSGAPVNAPEGCFPWFSMPTPRDPTVTLLGGHWAALGLRGYRGFLALDSGCIWGGPLTAFRMEDGAIFQVPNRDGALGR